MFCGIWRLQPPYANSTALSLKELHKSPRPKSDENGCQDTRHLPCKARAAPAV